MGMGSAIFSSLCLARAACTASVWISEEKESSRYVHGEMKNWSKGVKRNSELIRN